MKYLQYLFKEIQLTSDFWIKLEVQTVHYFVFFAPFHRLFAKNNGLKVLCCPNFELYQKIEKNENCIHSHYCIGHIMYNMATISWCKSKEYQFLISHFKWVDCLFNPSLFSLLNLNWFSINYAFNDLDILSLQPYENF